MRTSLVLYFDVYSMIPNLQKTSQFFCAEIPTEGFDRFIRDFILVSRLSISPFSLLPRQQ